MPPIMVTKYKNFPKKTESNSQIVDRILAKILRLRTRYSVSGNSLFTNGICLNAYRIVLTRYVFFRAKEMRHVLYIFFLPQGRYNLFLKVMAIQVAFFHRLQHAMAQEYDFIAQIKGKIHKMRGKDGDPSLL